MEDVVSRGERNIYKKASWIPEENLTFQAYCLGNKSVVISII